MYCYTYCPQSCRRPPPTHASTGDSWASLGQSLVGSLPLSPGSWCTQGSVCAHQESISQSCVSSGSSVVGLMATSSKRAYAILKSAAPSHTQVHCTQSPCPYSSPLQTRTSPGYTQTQFCLSLGVFSGSWCAQGLFEPSKHLWWV